MQFLKLQSKPSNKSQRKNTKKFVVRKLHKKTKELSEKPIQSQKIKFNQIRLKAPTNKPINQPSTKSTKQLINEIDYNNSKEKYKN